MLFERLVIDWAQDAAVAAVSHRVKLGWEAIWGIMQRAVRRGVPPPISWTVEQPYLSQ